MATKRADEKSFGTKMKQLRQTKKISFEDLANKTGFSQRYLKEIEEGIAIPPVSAVIQIAKALSIDSGSFLSAEEQEASERRRRESFFKRTQAYSYKTLTPDAETKHMKAFLVTIDPKQDHRMVEYKHEGEEFLYVLKGHIEVMVGENQNLLKKGETLHFNSDIAHKLRNLSDDEAKLLVVIYTP
jgi:quercetin dioxygenase-like cupin family protein